MSSHDIETESLPAHVSLCQERYRALEQRFGVVDEKIDAVNRMLEQIRDDLVKISENQSNRWNNVQIAVIAVLTTTVGALFARLVF